MGLLLGVPGSITVETLSLHIMMNVTGMVQIMSKEAGIPCARHNPPIGTIFKRPNL